MLQKFDYLLNSDWDRDELWERSFDTLCGMAAIPTKSDDLFDVDYDKCWEAFPNIKDRYFHGYTTPYGDKVEVSGRRSARVISYKLSTRDEVSLRGYRIVSLCSCPTCVNPTHLALIATKDSSFDKIRAQVTDPETWQQIRDNLNVLLAKRDFQEETFKANPRGYKKEDLPSLFPLMNATNDELILRATAPYCRGIAGMLISTYSQYLALAGLSEAFMASSVTFQRTLLNITKLYKPTEEMTAAEYYARITNLMATVMEEPEIALISSERRELEAIAAIPD